MERYDIRQGEWMAEKAEAGDFVLYADAQAMVEALQAQLVTLKRHADLDCGDQSCLYALAHSGMRTNGGCRCSPKRMKDDLERSRKAVEALQRERDKLREATKVICGHCCEPMAIPSKAILQSQLSALQGLVETIKCELFDRYDGAPDSPTRWMGPLIRDIEIAQALPATPTERGEGHSGDDTDMVQNEGGDGE